MRSEPLPLDWPLIRRIRIRSKTRAVRLVLPGASRQVGSSLQSAWLHLGRHGGSEGIAKEIAATSVLNEASDLRNA